MNVCALSLQGGLNILNILQKKRILKSCITPLAYLSTLASVACFSISTAQKFHMPYDSIDVLSAEFIFPRGSSLWGKVSNAFKQDFTEQKSQSSTINDLPQNQTNSNNQVVQSPENTEPQPQPSSPESQVDDEPHGENENTYKVIESQITAGGTKYENFYVKNSANYDINIASELSKRPDVKIKPTNEPQVLIMHTHTSEAYMKRDNGFFYESYYPRSTDNKQNVTSVGDAIAQKLNQNGINTIHDITYHDMPSYNGSYSRSRETVKSNLQKYPSIQVVLDIHRDSMGNRETGKIKPTFKYNGKKGAQVMIIAGCDKDGSIGFPDWETNLRFALRLHQKTESMFPGMTRPLNFNSVKYNMNLTHGSVLIEVGTDVNTIDEAVYSGSLLGDSLSEVLKELK